MSGDECVERSSSYVRLNVGGNLFCTTIGTLLRGNTMLNAMFSGRMEVRTDDEGWILIDRCGKHFGTVLNYIRDGSVSMPDNRRDLEELAAEARYFCIDGLRQACEDSLSRLTVDGDSQNRATIVIVKCPNAAKSLLSSTRKPVVKLTMNRYNNVFSYTSNSHDNLLRNIECLEKYALMFPETVLFVKDVRDKSEQNEICEWSYYFRGHRLKSIDCIAIHYSSEKRLIKVEFPESRIHEEMLTLLSVSSRSLTETELRDMAVRKANCPSVIGNSTLTSPLATGPHDSEESDLIDQVSTGGGGGGSLFSVGQTTTPSAGSNVNPPARPSAANLTIGQPAVAETNAVLTSLSAHTSAAVPTNAPSGASCRVPFSSAARRR